MKLVDSATGHEYYGTYEHKEKASKGLAGTALGFGIGGTVLGLLNGGLNLIGNGRPYMAGAAVATEKEDKCELINGMWQLAYNGQNARFADRQVLTGELFGLYKSQIDGDFNNYKFSRDSFDVVMNRIGELEKNVAVLAVSQEYEKKLTKKEIQIASDWANFNLYRRTCRMITGTVVLPNTPTVTGFESASLCNNGSTEAAADGQ